MINYGSAPSESDIEVTIFGPGYGEAIALHYGGGKWILVDSCLNDKKNTPASLEYLNQLGVQQVQVVAIIATHWHDDHVRGISKLARSYPDADFFISSVFREHEGLSFLAAYSGTETNGLSSGAEELFSVLKARKSQKNIVPTLHGHIVIEDTACGRDVIVRALSPLPQAVLSSVTRLSSYLPQKGEPINNAPPELNPNFESIALHIDFGNDAILLGADLEDHAEFGWSALLSTPKIKRRRPASIYKVAHHGSKTGHCDKKWEGLLGPNPISCMTPFVRGAVKLPKESDVTRIKGLTNQIFLTSTSSITPKIDSGILKRMNSVCKEISALESGFGAIRARRNINSSDWNIELFGNAKKL